MFSLFKSSYYLKDLLPNDYIDIHNHLLPGLDDGAKTVEETDLLIHQMKSININGAIATPHTFTGFWDNTSTSIKNAYALAIETELNRSFLKGYASEYMLDKTLMERLKNESLLCLPNSYVLVELSLFNNPINIYEMLFELKLKDYKIIIAHPERYFYFHHSIDKYKQLKNYGVSFQLNLLALTGYYGREIKKCAELLLENDLYDFTGTDIHTIRHIDYFRNKPFCFFNTNKLVDLLKNNSIFNQ